MKYRHQRYIAFDLTRKFNNLNELLDQLSYFLQGLEPGTSVPTTKTLAELKTIVKQMADHLSVKAPIIVNFVKAYLNAGYLEILGRDATTLQDQLTVLKQDADALREQILTVKNETKLRELAAAIVDDVPNLVPVEYVDSAIFKANAINDFLDASYYTLLGLDENTGQPHGQDAEWIRNRVRGYLRQISNYQTAWPEYLRDDVASMVAVADYVLANLEAVSFTELADYIGANVEKLPLLRRMWSK